MNKLTVFMFNGYPWPHNIVAAIMILIFLGPGCVDSTKETPSLVANEINQGSQQIENNDLEKTNQPTISINQYQGDVFNKRKECLLMQEQLTKNKNIIRDHSEYYVESVFYSPKVNSCLYVYRKIIKSQLDATSFKAGVYKIIPLHKGYIELVDAFDDHVIYSVAYDERSDCNGCIESIINAEGEEVTTKDSYQEDISATEDFNRFIAQYR